MPPEPAPPSDSAPLRLCTRWGSRLGTSSPRSSRLRRTCACGPSLHRRSSIKGRRRGRLLAPAGPCRRLPARTAAWPLLSAFVGSVWLGRSAGVHMVLNALKETRGDGAPLDRSPIPAEPSRQIFGDFSFESSSTAVFGASGPSLCRPSNKTSRPGFHTRASPQPAEKHPGASGETGRATCSAVAPAQGHPG